MPKISERESERQVNALMARALELDRKRDTDNAVEAYRAVLEHPCAYHQAFEYEVVDLIHHALRSAGRWDEAIEAKREAIEKGYRSVPDPETDIAECHLEAGRRAEADALFEKIRQADPEDIWLYNSAGFSYLGHDDREALRWSLLGIDLALETGDPEQVVRQLLDWAEAAWRNLQEPADEDLVAKVEAFCKAWKPPPATSVRDFPQLEPPELSPCDFCGFRPGEAVGGGHARWDVGAPGPPEDLNVATALAWFPESQWSEAVRGWPDLLDENLARHDDYSRVLEGKLKQFSEIGMRRLFVAPLTVDEVEAAKTNDNESRTDSSIRASCAAEVLRQGRAIKWPPGRNSQCWCGSGQKYKRCCGPAPAAPLTKEQ